MKLNFWQWLGVVLLIAGVTLWVYERWYKPQSPVQATPAVTESR